MRIFGRTRQRLLVEGALVRYLRYALGEILLVVIGILIALQVNDWNERRVERQQERAYLASMLEDLAEHRQRIERAVSANSILLQRLDDLLTLLAEPGSEPSLERQRFIHSLAYTYWYLRVDFSGAAFARLESGSLPSIEDVEVHEAILRYQAGIDTCEHQFAEMPNYFHTHEQSQKRVFNLALGKPAYEFIERDFLNMLQEPQAFEPLVAEGAYRIDDDPRLLSRYYGDVLFYRTALNNTTLFLAEQSRLAEELERLIRDRYGLPSGV